MLNPFAFCIFYLQQYNLGNVSHL
uniref:Uncharacterized protein n=1 Tax=Anguilla anguilla TaxID=7936 RepID=A0A0E9TC08_ANGAN